VVDEAVDHGGGDDFVADDLAPGAEQLVAGAISDARSERRPTSMNRRLTAWGSRGYSRE
jgi:hypothetical protein